VFVVGLVFGGYTRKKQKHINPLGLFHRGSGFMMIPSGGFRGKKRVVWCGVVLEENNINYILRFNSLIFLVEFVF